jgi:hypothetical protein
VLVRVPASLKDALVRETARRGASLNDVAVGMLADAFAVPYTPTGRRSGLPGASPVVLLRMPETLKREIQTEAFRTSTNTNDVIVRTLADGLGIPHGSRSRRSVPFGGGRGKDPRMAEQSSSQNGSARSKEKVRVAIIGVGNCANSLLQGVEYYKDAKPEETVPGLMHVDLAGTTSRTSSSRPPSTSSRARSASTSPRRSGRSRTTRSSSPTSRRPASRSRAG